VVGTRGAKCGDARGEAGSKECLLACAAASRLPQGVHAIESWAAGSVAALSKPPFSDPLLLCIV
jgi:hypothetical protein